MIKRVGTLDTNAINMAMEANEKNLLNILAPIDSPEFTGEPLSTTPDAGDDSTRIATTAWVQDEVVSLGLGDVYGPATATDNAIARYDGATGNLIQNSGITIADGATGTLSGTNTGDQTSIVGITGTTAEFNTALSDNDFATLAGAETLANKTLTTPTIGSFANATHTHANAAGGGQIDHTTALTNVGTNTHAQIDTHIAAANPHSGSAASGANTDITSVYLNNTGLKVKDTNASHGLTLKPGSDLTADKTLTLTTGDADRTLTLGGDTTLSGGTHSGTNTGDQTIELTGDVTGSGTGTFAATIANDAVTNGKAANMAQSTIKGRAVGAGTGDPTDLTATQATAILDAFTGDSGAGGVKGLVPAPAAGDAAASKYLKADGTWATAGGALSDADYGDITVGGGGTTMTIDNDAVTYPKMQNVSATQRALARKTAGAGDVEECTTSELLDFIGSTRGSVLYRGAAGWAALSPGTDGYVLTSAGAGADPAYEAPGPGSAVAMVALGGQVFVSKTMTNIGTSYADIYAAAFDNENLCVIDFTGVSHVRIVYMVDYVGAGTQTYRWVDAADNANVLIEAASITSDADPADTGWVSLPAAFSSATKTIEMQGKSTTAGDDPVVKGYAIFVKSSFVNLLSTPLGEAYGGSGVTSHMRARAYQSSSQSISTGTETAVTFTTETYDVGGFHDNATNTNRFTVPTGGDGHYELKAQIYFPANGTGIRYFYLRKNGSATPISLRQFAGDASTDQSEQIVGDSEAVATDYFDLVVYQNSGGAMNLTAGTHTTWMSVRRTGA